MADRAGHQGCHPKQVEPQTTFQLRQEILQTATPHRECLLPAQRFPTHRYPRRQARQKFPRLRLPRRCRCMVDFMSRDPSCFCRGEATSDLSPIRRWVAKINNGQNPMLQSEFEEHYADLTRAIIALEAKLADSEASKPLADIKRRIEILYETLKENRLLLETVLENSAASIYAKGKDGRYTYINRGMEDLCNVTREGALGKTDSELFPSEIAQQFRTNDLAAMKTGKLKECEETVQTRSGERLALSKKVPLLSS